MRPWSPDRLSMDIVAPATAEGEAGIASFDLDGPYIFEKLPKVFRRGSRPRRLGMTGRRPPSAAEAGSVIYGSIVSEDGETLDEAILAVHGASGSPTRRAWATISAHGGAGVRSALLDALRQAGFEEALPGEMAARACLAGTISLVEVERDLRIPACRTRRQAAALFFSTSWLKDRLGRAAMDGLLMLRSGQIGWRAAMADETDAFLAGAARIRALLRRHDVAVIGPVNAGKSSLVNALCGEERLIVTDIPGTTRDVVRVDMSLRGLSVRMADTAGMRPPADEPEREGQSLALRAAAEADLVIVLLEGCRPAGEWERRMLSKVGWRRAILVVSKADLPAEAGCDFADSVAAMLGVAAPLRVSSVSGAGLEELRCRIEEILLGGDVRPSAAERIVESPSPERGGREGAGAVGDTRSSEALGSPDWRQRTGDGASGCMDASKQDMRWRGAAGAPPKAYPDAGPFTERQTAGCKKLLDALLSSAPVMQIVAEIRSLVGSRPDVRCLEEVFEEAERTRPDSAAP